MIFKEKGMNLKYIRYTEDRKTLDRRIKFNRSIAEDINRIIAVYNFHNDEPKLNNSILVSHVMEWFISELEKVSEDEAMNMIKSITSEKGMISNGL